MKLIGWTEVCRQSLMINNVLSWGEVGGGRMQQVSIRVGPE